MVISTLFNKTKLALNIYYTWHWSKAWCVKQKSHCSAENCSSHGLHDRIIVGFTASTRRASLTWGWYHSFPLVQRTFTLASKHSRNKFHAPRVRHTSCKVSDSFFLLWIFYSLVRPFFTTHLLLWFKMVTGNSVPHIWKNRPHLILVKRTIKWEKECKKF